MPPKELVTIDSILEWCVDAVETHKPVETRTWRDAALKLCVLIGNLNEEQIAAHMAFRRLHASFLDQGLTNAAAETRAKASEAYEQNLRLTAKVEQINEMIKIVKKNVDFKEYQV